MCLQLPQPLPKARSHDTQARATARRFTGHESRICFNSEPMPKVKTHSGAKKRFRKTATGRIRARHAMTSHNLGKKARKRKRRLGRPVEIAEGDRHEVVRLLAGRGRKQ